MCKSFGVWKWKGDGWRWLERGGVFHESGRGILTVRMCEVGEVEISVG